MMMNNVSDVRKTVRDLIKENRGGTLRQIKIGLSAFLRDPVRIAGAVSVIKEELTCGICLEIVLQTCVTRCKHVFCKFCVDMSLVRRRECPMCRCVLTEPSHLTLLPKADRIVETVMSSVNPNYVSWQQNEITERNERYDEHSEVGSMTENERNIMEMMIDSDVDDDQDQHDYPVIEEEDSHDVEVEQEDATLEPAVEAVDQLNVLLVPSLVSIGLILSRSIKFI